MADPDGELTVAQRLGRALDRGLLPAGGPAEAAERLIERLERPARVALLGLPGSGKSSILNLLVGAIVVPETLRLPTIIVQHGAEAQMICTLTDGTTKIVPGSELAEVLPLAPALVTLELDLPALKVISLLEVSAGPMEAEQRRAATWASKRADIVIWCSTSYLPKEQTVWESLPDSVKDNSFMLLTKVDLLGSRESASAMHDRVEQRAAEEFRQILSISAKQARAAMPQGGPVNRDMFRDSGASAVITAIKTRVQSGRRADMDTAELLLARHVEASELVARRFAEPGEEAEAPQTWTPPPEPEAAEVVRSPELPEEEPAAVELEEALEAASEEELAALAAALEPEAEVEDAPEVAELAEVEAEPEPEPEPEDEPEPESEPEAEVVDETPPEAELEPEALAETPAAFELEPEPETTTRKRFADRIKRVATSEEAASAPLVPLRSTWKSKAETEAAAEPPPAARPPEPVKRSRTPVSAPPDDGDVARMLANVASAPVPAATPPRERTPRALPPAAAATPEPPRAARPQLFGARRPASGQREPEAPLPDLSALRARPELEETGEEALPEDLDSDEPMDVEPLEPEVEAAAPEPEFDEPAEEAPKPVERPRLFDREPRVRPADPPQPRPGPTPRATPTVQAPVSRSPAPPRMQAPTAEVPEPRPPVDDSQFSPRAIMMRERRADAEALAVPRRERPRIAARAIAAPAAPVGASPVLATDLALLDEAVGLIISRSTELAQEIDPEAKVPVDMILDHARETTDQIIAIVSRGRSEPLRRINSDLGEVLDVIMLMQLEKGHAPADDALTLLLQLRRELETLRAA